MRVPYILVYFIALIIGFIQPSIAADRLLKDDRDCVLYIGFDRYRAEYLLDDSPYNNKAMLQDGAIISKKDGSCGVCAQMLGGRISIDGKNFKGRPSTQITVALMVNLVNAAGTHKLFETVGDHSKHSLGQYHLEVVEGKLRWFHRNENGDTIFSAITDREILQPDTWLEIVAMYDMAKGRAVIYVDGQVVKEELSDPMRLSQDWGAFAGIGGQKDAELRGYVDEFYIFNRTLEESEIKQLHDKCKGPLAANVLHLDFMNTTSNMTKDTSFQGNNGYFVGTVVSGLNGTCDYGVKVADGGSSEVNVDGSSFRNKPTDAVTIVLWIKLDDNTGNHQLFQTIGGHSMHTRKQYDLRVNDGALYWIHHNEYNQEIFNVKTVPIVVKDSWTNIAVSYDSDKEVAIVYVDGEIKEGSNGAGALSVDWDGDASFGKHNSSAGSYDWLDEIYMFDRELTPLEIRTLFMKCSYILNYESGYKPQIIYLNFDRITGEKVYDDSGYGNDGKLINFSQLARDAGKCGHGIRFQGGNILLDGDQLVNKPLTGITIAVWVYVDSNEGQQELFQTVDPNSDENRHGQFYLELSDGRVRWFHRNAKGETIFSVETHGPVVFPETWTHIAGTYDSEKKKAIVFINGVVSNEEGGSGLLSQDWKGRVSIGRFYDLDDSGKWIEGRPFYGILDEFYMYNKALSGVHISKLSQICDFRRIVLFLGFTRIVGPKIFDQSGLSNDAAFRNNTDLCDGVCGQGVNFTSQGYVELNGSTFRQKPLTAISISTWLRLNTNRGIHELFNTIGSRSMHTHDQFHFQISDGTIVWSHKNENEKEIFTLTTLAIVKPRQWVNLIATYDAQELKAKIYLNGQLVKEAPGSGYLSQDWGHFAGIGRHYYHPESGFNGAIDNYFIANYALAEEEIQYISRDICEW
eukprot:gene12811-14124_t